MSRLRSALTLLLTALIWGAAFVAQSKGNEHIGPWTFTCLRFVIGGFTLLALMPLLDRLRGNARKPVTEEERRHLFKAGILCGVFLCAASVFQQTGILYTTVGKAGFLTALYVILVPLLGMFAGTKTDGKVWLAALIALGGFWLLSVKEGFSIAFGDLLLVACSILFAGHILVIDRYGHNTDGVRLSCVQFFTASLLCLVPMIVIEKPSLSAIHGAWAPVLYAGVLSSGAGYTLQIIGQKGIEPAAAGMILSLESVFSALAGFVILHQVLSSRELLGCALVFAAVIIAQLPAEKNNT